MFHRDQDKRMSEQIVNKTKTRTAEESEPFPCRVALAQ